MCHCPSELFFLPVACLGGGSPPCRQPCSSDQVLCFSHTERGGVGITWLLLPVPVNLPRLRLLKTCHLVISLGSCPSQSPSWNRTWSPPLFQNTNFVLYLSYAIQEKKICQKSLSLWPPGTILPYSPNFPSCLSLLSLRDYFPSLLVFFALPQVFLPSSLFISGILSAPPRA